MKPLISEDITLEQLTAKVINDMGHPVKRLEKAKLSAGTGGCKLLCKR